MGSLVVSFWGFFEQNLLNTNHTACCINKVYKALKTNNKQLKMIKTSRLIITKLSEDDKSFIYELLNSPGWLKYIGNRGIETLADAVEYLHNGPMKSYEEHGYGLFKVALKEKNVPIGICGFLNRAYLSNIDLGYAFLPQFGKKGYAYEAAEALLHWIKAEKKIDTLLAITGTNNERSIKLLEKLAFLLDQKIKWPGDEEEVLQFIKKLD